MTIHNPFNYDAFLSREHLSLGGRQHIFRFPNGYGASVVRAIGTHGSELGLYELAVLVFTNNKWDLTYETPVTNDVIGYLSVSEVNDVLDRIKDL